jgi:predicted regulator of Ras-like GTPase activity (Roadblock/LC7/MglB family)
MVRVPAAAALKQLPLGAVTISFHELRMASPAGLFSSCHELDSTPVELPLREILTRLGPDQLARRSGQRRLAVPDEVAGVFRNRSQEHKPEVRPVQPAPAAPAAPAAPQLDRLNESQAVARLKVVPPAAHKPEAIPNSSPVQAPKRLDHAPLHTYAAKVPAEVPDPKAPEKDTVKVALVSASRDWPEEFRRKILSTHMSASLQIPFSELEAAMKRGKAAFSWRQLRSWITPQGLHGTPEQDTIMLVLPLPLLTPLFLARRSSISPSRKVTVGDEIPDVFQNRKSETAAEPAATSKSEELSPRRDSDSAPKLKVNPGPGILPVMPDLTRSGALSPGNGHAFGTNLLSTNGASAPVPGELVRHACALNGVTGALLATLDGLVIASELPPEFKAETVAGFLPEMHGRLQQYTRELKLGDPSLIEMMAGKLPLLIQKTNSAYFAVLGKTGEPMPKLQLTALACQLNSRNK